MLRIFILPLSHISFKMFHKLTVAEISEVANRLDLSFSFRSIGL
jgi:hypothetical protein